MASWFSKQRQVASGASTAVQAKGDVIIYQGVTASEARDIANDVFKSNMLQYRGVAMEVAAQRGEELTDNFVAKMQSDNPAGFEQAKSPSFQDDMFVAQKEYAKAGEQDLGELLVDLLVDRSKETQRSTLQIVLSESLRVAPKLTQAQINTLSVIFLCRYVVHHGGSFDAVSSFYKTHLGAIADAYATSRSAFNHLSFAGCGTLQMGSWDFRGGLVRIYSALFQKGLDESQVQSAGLPDNLRAEYVGKCLNDPQKLQVLILGEETLANISKKRPDVKLHEEKFKALLSQGLIDQQSLNDKLDSLAPFMPKILEDWAASDLKSFDLSSVGMAIGHANIKRHTGEFARLSIWIE